MKIAMTGSGVLGTALRGPAHCVSTPAGGVQMNFGSIKRAELNDKVCEVMEKAYRDGGCDAYWHKDDVYKYLWKKVIVTNIGDYYPSMAQDMLFNQRQTEIDVLNGKIAEYGEELGIPCPTCAVLSTVVRCIQGNYDKQYFKK